MPDVDQVKRTVTHDDALASGTAHGQHPEQIGQFEHLVSSAQSRLWHVREGPSLFEDNPGMEGPNRLSPWARGGAPRELSSCPPSPSQGGGAGGGGSPV